MSQSDMGWLKAECFILLYSNHKVVKGWSSPNTALSFLMDTVWDSEDMIFSQHKHQEQQTQMNRKK